MKSLPAQNTVANKHRVLVKIVFNLANIQMLIVKVCTARSVSKFFGIIVKTFRAISKISLCVYRLSYPNELVEPSKCLLLFL
jgi:hypothetical protein